MNVTQYKTRAAHKTGYSHFHETLDFFYHDHHLIFSGSSVQTTCVLLRRCGVTCGGGLDTRITTREELMSGACVKHKGSYSE